MPFHIVIKTSRSQTVYYERSVSTDKHIIKRWLHIYVYGPTLYITIQTKDTPTFSCFLVNI
jgi:hypothetical protein